MDANGLWLILKVRRCVKHAVATMVFTLTSTLSTNILPQHQQLTSQRIQQSTTPIQLSLLLVALRVQSQLTLLHQLPHPPLSHHCPQSLLPMYHQLKYFLNAGWRSYNVDGGSSAQWIQANWLGYGSSKSWSTQKTRCMKVKCVGVFTCSTEGCAFLKRPSPTRKKLEEQISSSTCSTHRCSLLYASCKCVITWKEETETNKQTLLHKETHRHPRPPVIRLPTSALEQLTRQVLNCPSITPKALLVGSSFNASVRNLHESNNNLDRVGYRRRKILKSHHVEANLNNMIRWQVRCNLHKTLYMRRCN